jgi:hypothetical protein
MALTASSPASRVGLINGGAVNTDVNALFLKVFSGEILTTFEESNIMKGLHNVRTISSGKTAQFPATGIASATYHSAGESLLETESAGASKYLSDIKKNEITIAIDDVLIASTFLANIDELKTHFDVRSIYAQELGKALAKRFDIAVMKTLVAGARQSATVSGGNGGIQVTGQDDTTGTGLLNALFEVAEKLDENDIPADDRYAIVTPAQYYKLISDPDTNIALNRDYGGEGSVAQGSVPMIAGIRIYKSNHLSDVKALADASAGTTDDANDGVNNDVFGDNGVGYDGNFTATKFLAGHKAGLGTVKLLDLATESEYQIERQGTLFVAKYAMGHGVIRPEACVEVTA